MSKKGINTRQQIATAEQPYVWHLCDCLLKKIDQKWTRHQWQTKGFGNSLKECRALNKFDPFLKSLRQDIQNDLTQKNYRSTAPSESTLEKLLGDPLKRPHFFQHEMKEILAIYVGYENWANFKAVFKQKINSLPAIPPKIYPNFILIENTPEEKNIQETPFSEENTMSEKEPQNQDFSFLPAIFGNSQIVIRKDQLEQAETVADLYEHFFGTEQDEEVPFEEIKERKFRPLLASLFFILWILTALFSQKEPIIQFYKEWKFQKFTQAELDKVVFEVDTIYGLPNAPKTLQVRYDVSHLEGDSVEVRFASSFDWRYDPRVNRIEKKAKAAHLYYSPVHEQIELYVDRQLVKTIHQKIQFSNWVATVFQFMDNDQNRSWQGIDSAKVWQKGRLHIPPQIIDQKDYPEPQTKFTYFPLKELPIDGDHCTILYRIRNSTEDGGLRGKTVSFGINNGRNEKNEFGIISCKNSYWNRIICGKSVFNANSFLNSTVNKIIWDFEEWRTVKIEINQPNLKIWFEDKLVWESIYEDKIGVFESMEFAFGGSGTVDFVRIWNEKEELVYEENFE